MHKSKEAYTRAFARTRKRELLRIIGIHLAIRLGCQFGD